MSRIIRDHRNARLDYFIPTRRAEELFAKGKLYRCGLNVFVTRSVGERPE